MDIINFILPMNKAFIFFCATVITNVKDAWILFFNRPENQAYYKSSK